MLFLHYTDLIRFIYVEVLVEYMFRMKTKIGLRGQIVIPKVIRKSLGLTDNKGVILEVDKKTLKINSTDDNIVEKWGTIAKREGLNVKKEFVYGDKLYEDGV
jgi:AbrB family looped-hinge helix DNA binding protein